MSVPDFVSILASVSHCVVSVSFFDCLNVYVPSSLSAALSVCVCVCLARLPVPLFLSECFAKVSVTIIKVFQLTGNDGFSSQSTVAAKSNVGLTEATDVTSVKLSGQVVHVLQPEVLTPTSVQLRWEVRRSQRYIDGFHVKYSIVPVSDVVEDADQQQTTRLNGQQQGTIYYDNGPAVFSIQTIKNAEVRSYQLQGLEEHTRYRIFIQPFYQNVEGTASNTVYVQTLADG